MAIYDFFLSRNNGPTLENYVGHTGRMFYDSEEKVLRVSDGTTPGGFPITPTTLVSTTEPAVAAEGQMWYNPNTLELWAYHNGNFEPTIDLATETKIGGVKLGPGVITNPEGQIIIDSTGLDFSFGDFSSVTGVYPEGHPKVGENYALLSSVNVNEDIVIASNGDGVIRLVGEFRIYPANGSVNGSLLEVPKFRISEDGQIRILIPAPDNLAGGVQIVGNADGLQQKPVNSGVMLQITGHDSIPARSYVDSISAYAGFVGRRANGTSVAPSGVLADDEVTRFAANAFTSDNGYETTGIGQLRWYANENISSTNKGGRAEFWVVPNGTANTVKIVTVDGNGITMATGKTITGTVSTATNLAAATNILTGTITIDPSIVTKNTASVQTFTLTGLTTNHKITITPGTAFGYGMFVSAAWASAANTLSVEFQNVGNSDINLTAKTIQYFAWV